MKKILEGTIEIIGVGLVAFICSVLPIMLLMYLAEKILFWFFK